MTGTTPTSLGWVRPHLSELDAILEAASGHRQATPFSAFSEPLVSCIAINENNSDPAEPNFLAEFRRHAAYFYHRRHQF
jgi:hypothetical protein